MDKQEYKSLQVNLHQRTVTCIETMVKQEHISWQVNFHQPAVTYNKVMMKRYRKQM